MLEALINLELALVELTNDTERIKMGLLALLQAHITPMILPDDVLLEVLREASIRPTGLFPTMPEYLCLYREITRAVARSTV